RFRITRTATAKPCIEPAGQKLAGHGEWRDRLTRILRPWHFSVLWLSADLDHGPARPFGGAACTYTFRVAGGATGGGLAAPRSGSGGPHRSGAGIGRRRPAVA